MPTVSVNTPKTPATKGSGGIAAATIPNVCKMPGPPAPFVPTPLPNIGKSSERPKGYTKRIRVEGQPVAIKGASFGSFGDAASKASGGGLVSANTHGPTKFIAPGALDVKFEGKNVHLLGDQMLNNCGPGGSPANSATLMGLVQGIVVVPMAGDGDLNCPHPNMLYDTAANDGQRRLDLNQKIADQRTDVENLLVQAVAHEAAGAFASANAAMNLAIERERSANADTFEQKVARDTNAREVSKKFKCPDCLMNGEIDVVTDRGVIKECKTGKPKLKQLKKLESAARVIFPGASVHLAVPIGMRVETPWPTIQRH